jgi:hypothetical protein
MDKVAKVVGRGRRTLGEPVFYISSGDVPTLEAANRRTAASAVLCQLKPDACRSMML